MYSHKDLSETCGISKLWIVAIIICKTKARYSG